MQSINANIMAQYRQWLRLGYVDDTFVIINRNDLENFHAIINSMSTNITFSRDEEQNSQLPFLDILVQTQGDGVATHGIRE